MNLKASLAVALLLFVAGCIQPYMENQRKYEVYEYSGLFEDGRASRTPPVGTVARGSIKEVPNFDDQLVRRTYLIRGKERYQIYCAVCHGMTGQGDGMVVQRGFPAPPSLHETRLVAAPMSHIVTVIKNGMGQMYPYADRVGFEDRWAIALYVKALQLSQNFPMERLSAEEQRQVEAGK